VPQTPLIPAHSRSKNGVLSHAYGGNPALTSIYADGEFESQLDPRFRGGERSVWFRSSSV